LGCPVSVLLENISSKELTEWMAYFKIKHQEQEKEMKDANKNTNKKGKRQVF
jgi:hypothetical protein